MKICILNMKTLCSVEYGLRTCLYCQEKNPKEQTRKEQNCKRTTAKRTNPRIRKKLTEQTSEKKPKGQTRKEHNCERTNCQKN